MWLLSRVSGIDGSKTRIDRDFKISKLKYKRKDNTCTRR